MTKQLSRSEAHHICSGLHCYYMYLHQLIPDR